MELMFHFKDLYSQVSLRNYAVSLGRCQSQLYIDAYAILEQANDMKLHVCQHIR